MLMDKALSFSLTRQELIDLNLVRTFLRVTSVSDIATADGEMVHPFSWRGYPIPDRVSCTSFTRQAQPTTYQRDLWRRLLRSLFILLRPQHRFSSGLLWATGQQSPP
jgi:hypothetical protein